VLNNEDGTKRIMIMIMKNPLIKVKCRECVHCGKIRKNVMGEDANDCNASASDGIVSTDFLSVCSRFKSKIPNHIILWRKKLKRGETIA